MSTHTVPPAPSGSKGTDPGRITSLLATLWQRNLPEVAARLSVLDLAANAATRGALTLDLQKEAASVAHKLAGSLGMYGHAHASHLARSIEQMLETPWADDRTRLLEHTVELRQAIPF